MEYAYLLLGISAFAAVWTASNHWLDRRNQTWRADLAHGIGKWWLVWEAGERARIARKEQARAMKAGLA